jgi:hypothetical protein
MANTRHAILENLKTELAKIKVVNGYQTNIVSVSRKFRSWENLTSEKFPCLFVLDDGRETVEDESGDYVFVNMYPAIVGYVKDENNVALAFGKLDSDLKKFLYSNPNLGANCKMILYKGYDDIFTLDDTIIFQLSPQILYDFLKTNP